MNYLITGAVCCAEKVVEFLRNLGHDVWFMPNEKEALPVPVETIDGVICNGLFLNHNINQFKKLKYIQLTSAGFDRVPMDYIKENEIAIYNARGVYSIPMAEFALCGVLYLCKQSGFFLKNQKEHKWEKHRNLIEISGKTVCVVGCGSVGRECAKRFRALGSKVLGVDVYPLNNGEFDEIVGVDGLDEILKISDIVILTLPLTDDTRNLFDKKRFARMKKDSIFVNIARGKIVKTDALIDALKNNLFGAVLDVFEEEPLSQDSPLWDMQNVVITPHNSFVGDGNSDRLFKVITENLKRI